MWLRVRTCSVGSATDFLCGFEKENKTTTKISCSNIHNKNSSPEHLRKGSIYFAYKQNSLL